MEDSLQNGTPSTLGSNPLTLEFAQALDALETLDLMAYPDSVLALAQSAVRGSLYEVKWRGSTQNVPKEIRAKAVARARERLEKLPASAKAITFPELWCLGPRVGWGTYRWDYNPVLPETALRERASIIDTAETYGYGRVETKLGEVFAAMGKEYRADTCIATKVSRSHMSARSVRNALSRSIKRLGGVDLYQIHWPNPDVPIEETMGAMGKLLEEGVVEAIGVCNFSLDQLWEAQRICPNISSIQLRAAPEDMQWIEAEMLRYCAENFITIIGHSPFGQGSIHTGFSQTPENASKDALRGCRKNMITAIPGTNNVRHLLDNLHGL